MENIDKNQCDSIKELIFSDEVLSDEQQNHIKNCPDCSNLLLQKQAMLNDLAKINFIEDATAFSGKIIEKINNTQHKRASQIRFSRYAATAAAAVVVFASLFVLHNNTQIADNNNAIEQVKLKNNLTMLEDNIDSEVSYKTDDGSYDAYEYADESFYEEAAEDMAKELVEQETAPENSRVMLKAVRPETKNEAFADSCDSVQEENSKINSSAYDLSCEEQALLFSAAAPVSEPNDDNQNSEIEEKGASGGGGAASRVESESFEQEVVHDESIDAEKENLPFCDIEFLGGEENIQYNLELLQHRLDDIFKEKYVVDAFAFKNAGHSDRFFVDTLTCMTEKEFLAFIKSSGTFVYEK